MKNITFHAEHLVTGEWHAGLGAHAERNYHQLYDHGPTARLLRSALFGG